MKNKINILFLLLFGLTTTFAQTAKKPVAKKPTATKTATAAKPQTANPTDGIFAEIETSKGKIVLALEYKKTPITVANFISLAEGTNTAVKDEKLKGKPFYNGLKFHRVIADFMIQGGDPQGNGSGGPGYAFKDEIVADLKHNSGGILSMANSGPKTNGSQFFITHKETPWLDGKHTVFGKVTTGMDVVNAIKQDDLINKITIVRKGADAKKFDATKIFSDYIANKANEDKMEAEVAAENKRKAAEAEATKKAEYNAKYGAVIAAKASYLNNEKATATETPSGLKYKIIKQGTGKKPADGTNVLIHYAGYLEDGSLFDSSYDVVNKEYGKFDENRAKANGYQPFPFQYGKKDGLIPGFIETLSNMNYGDKAIAFIPSKLGYGERGAGNVIPPNANIIFEIEMIEAPAKKE
ncbi:peptidylprolyl isomerase [Flavobacterium dankookense]|uniref:peptidylprolyl isomerase n=1 Tax=Flavobacterium dankookense TaxID=706186 RepID=A0A4R6Q6A1_9FLAO|nr:peptidylprolyl isomerase [Flavobacterium dankookense]TDP57968.1 cyclophilin family peptidyl-prolyl cis-trans isomerase [Flavobacterium dankookense]